MKKLLIFISLISFLIFFSINLEAKDKKNSQDHSLIERYPGSSITHYDVIDFDRYSLALSAPEYVKPKVYKAETTLELEGKITRLVYSIDKKTSNYQLYKNYLNALSKPGFEILKTCYEDECIKVAKFYSRFYKQRTPGALKDKSPTYYTVAKQSRPDQGDIYIMVLNGETNLANISIVHIIETQKQEVGLIKTNANALLESLDNLGKAEIYDIHFDTGKADIKTDSAPALKEIAKVLELQPTLSLYVVGHTDDTGSLTLNEKLSTARAKAITQYLMQEHKISTERLYGVGVGPFAPIASNETPTGRSKNRRVELIKRIVQ